MHTPLARRQRQSTPQGAQRAPANRSQFDGFVTADEGATDELARIVSADSMKRLYRQSVKSELTCCCAFLTVTAGEEGEPPVIVSAHPATAAAAVWDDHMHRVAEGMVVVDNPSSAEAIYAAKEALVIDAQNLNADNGEALRDVALMALAASRGTDYAAVEGEQLAVQAKFRNPAMPSVVSQSDAMVKMISALPWLAESDVALEELGFSDDQIQRLRSDRAKATSRAASVAECREYARGVMSGVIQRYDDAAASLAAEWYDRQAAGRRSCRRHSGKGRGGRPGRDGPLSYPTSRKNARLTATTRRCSPSSPMVEVRRIELRSKANPWQVSPSSVTG